MTYSAIFNGLRIEVLPDVPDELSMTVRIAGEIDISNAGALHEALLVACEPDRRMVVEMDQVGFIDSSGINALIRIVNQTGIQHRGLVVQNPSSNVLRIVEVLGLLRTLGLDESDPLMA